MLESIRNFLQGTGVALLFEDSNWWKYLVMYAIVAVLVYLAVVRKYEPLLLLPIAIGMLLTNLPGAELFHFEMWIADPQPTVLQSIQEVINHGGFLDLIYMGVKLGIFPCLIFIGIGAMTDFSPLIARPSYLLIGGGAQLGVFAAFALALVSGMFTPQEAAAIGIIGGADGPTAVLTAKTLAPQLLGAIAIAAYSYMALIPMIQPPFMKLFTTKKERAIRMQTLRSVSKLEKVCFPVLVTVVVGMIVPAAVPLIGCLMFGNLLNVSGVTERLSKTAQNEMINIVTILLGLSVGATATATQFLDPKTLLIIACGLTAFCISTCGGLIVAKIMCWLTGGKVNPLIGSAGVSAVPMAARVSQKMGQEADPSNYLLMHAMGPNVAGVIGSAIAAGVFLSWAF